MVSGVPEQIGGKWVGFTDFTEFALQGAGALPAGLTLRGNAFPNAPNSFAVVADGTVGRYLSMSGQDTSHWGVTLDAFDALSAYGEFVARIWIATNTANRRLIGPILMSNDIPAALDALGGHIYKRSPDDYESAYAFWLNGDLDSGAWADMRFAEQAGVWVWLRFRKFVGNPTTSDGVLVKSWYGEFEDEPPGWDYVNPSVPQLANADRMGWGMQAAGNPDEQRIAFFSFTEDPNVSIAPPPGGFPTPPPSPGDVVAPTVDGVDPLQATWVGLQGSPFETLP